jgi:Uma2 family endonuclease
MVTAMSGPEFDALPYEEGRLWELIEGELIPHPSPTSAHQMVAQEVLFALAMHLDANPEQGIVLSAVEFALNPDCRVCPERFRPPAGTCGVARYGQGSRSRPPAIAIEVIFPDEFAADSQAKLEAYLRHGTRERIRFLIASPSHWVLP